VGVGGGLCQVANAPPGSDQEPKKDIEGRTLVRGFVPGVEPNHGGF